MAIIKYENGQDGIFNDLGRQVTGSHAANSEGLNPRELIEACIGLCLSINLTTLLERDGKLGPDTKLEITVTGVKAEDSVSRFGSFDVDVRLPEGLEAAYEDKILLMAERACTLSNTIKHGAEVHTKKL